MSNIRRKLSEMLHRAAEYVDPEIDEDEYNNLVIDTLQRHPDRLSDNVTRNNNEVLRRLKEDS
jgi:hypothetical protein